MTYAPGALDFDLNRPLTVVYPDAAPEQDVLQVLDGETAPARLFPESDEEEDEQELKEDLAFFGDDSEDSSSNNFNNIGKFLAVTSIIATCSTQFLQLFF